MQPTFPAAKISAHRSANSFRMRAELNELQTIENNLSARFNEVKTAKSNELLLENQWHYIRIKCGRQWQGWDEASLWVT